MSTLLKTSFAVLLCATVAISAKGQGVTDNIVYKSEIYYSQGSYAVLPIATGVETGNQVNLDGTARFVTGFSFNYSATDLSIGATADVKFYDATGVTGTTSDALTLLYDTKTFLIGNSTAKELTFNQTDLLGGFAGKESMIWTVTFNYTSGNAYLIAGTPVPTIGGRQSDYVTYDSTTFLHVYDTGTTGNGYQGSFAATITAVPEPSTFALLGLGSLASMALIRRRK